MATQLSKLQYIRRKSLTRVAFLHPSLPGDLHEQLWNDPAELVRTGNMLNSTNQRRTLLVNWKSRKFVLKQYRPTYWHLVKQLPTRSWSAATFNVTIKLVNAGMQTPLPLACVENRWGGLRRNSYLMYEYVEGESLRSFLQHATEHQQPRTEYLLRQVSDLCQRLVTIRASLADVHTGNFIICPAGRLWVIDLDKARFHRTAHAAAPAHEHALQKFNRSIVQHGSPFAAQNVRLVA